MIGNATIEEPPVPVLRYRVDMEAYGRAQGYRPEWNAEDQILTLHLSKNIIIEIHTFPRAHGDINEKLRRHTNQRGNGSETQSETAWSPEMAKSKRIAAPVGHRISNQ